MPRIDPLQLLTCLSVLLSPDGGILSRDEVPRLVNLMTKFSKKLVSKCIYILILKNTETSLVDMFMAEGGWALIQNWLQDGVQTGNWGLVKEILGLMLVTPVDVDRLKTNSLPKLIKNLSRREDLGEVAQISNQIVQKWLSIVKGTTHSTTVNGATAQSQVETPIDPAPISSENKSTQKDNQSENKDVVDGEEDNSEGSNEAINTATFYKLSVKDGKQVIRKLSVESDRDNSGKGDDDKAKESDKDKSKSKSSSSSRSSSSSSKSSSSSSKEKDRDRDKDKKKSSSSSSSSSSKSKSSSSSRDKDRDRKDKDRDRKDKNKQSSPRSSSKSSDKDKKEKDKSKTSSSSDSKNLKEKEKQSDNDKDMFDKIKTNSLDKLGRIPKKSSGTSDGKEKENKTASETAEKKKPSFSILNRKATGEERTKTVKVFNSKMRSTGLEEEAKPPPPRSSTKKPTPSVQLPTIPSKRPSPPREPSLHMPPEKKIKIDRVDIPDRPGAIKLIPPKPKPAVLQESDMFMDALTAAAPKKETKKRKRRLSATKEVGPLSSPSTECPQSSEASTTQAPNSPTSLGLKNIAPFNFYQDTLSQETGEDKTDQEKEPAETEDQTADTPASPPTPTDTENVMDTNETPAPTKMKLDGGLKGVLLFTKKKGPKRSIKWKADDDLVEVRYFELDETERVNVTKTFNDMAKMELSSEREALIMSRKLSNEDVMEAQMVWRPLFICEQAESLAVPGSKSLEKDIQFAREKTSVPALYFDKRRIPDSPEEPIPENHQISDPVIIPLDDPEGQEIDLRQTPWPEPKNTAPQTEPQIPPVYPNMPFNGNFNNMPPVPFMGVPNRFPGPPGPHGPIPPGPGNFVPPNMMHNNMMGPPMNQPDMMNSGMPMNPAMYGPGPDGFIPHVNNDPNFPMQQFNGPQGPNMNMYGPNNFNHRGGGRGGFRRGGNNNGGWVPMNPGQRPWQRGGGGGGPRGGRLCKNKQNHGYCRNEPKCPFIH